MKHSSLSTLFCMSMLICSCTSHISKNSKFTLNGEINYQDTGLIILEYASNAKLISDTAIIKNNHFMFTGSITEPTHASLYGRNYSEIARIFLETHNMKIQVLKDKPLGSKMTGSKTQSEYESLIKMEEPIYERLSELRAEGFRIRDSIKNSQDGIVKPSLEKKMAEIDSLSSVTLDELDPIELKFVLENPNSFLTPFCLLRLATKEIITLDSVKSIFNGLEKHVQNSRYAKLLVDDIRKKGNTRIGAQAPDFKAVDLNHQAVTLSQFKGNKVVLLDFWASWCIPCRENTPFLKTMYKKFHPKGLEIIAISIDENKENWINAVKRDSIGMWYNIPVAERFAEGPTKITDDDIYQNYYYNGVPTEILIDKEGKIIHKSEGYSKENADSLNRILVRLFEN